MSNYFSLATYHYKNQGSIFPNMLIPRVFLVNKQWKMMLQVSNSGGLILNLSLPLTHLHRMYPIVLCNLVNGLDPSHRLKPHLGLELRKVNAALSCIGHDLPRF